MGATSTAVARANAHRGVFASIGAVVLVLAFLGTAVVDSLANASHAALADGLASATGTDGAARWQIRMAADADAQAEAAASVLDRMLVPNGAVWSRSVQTAPVDASSGETAFDAVLLADPSAEGRAELVDGAWPEDANGTADAGTGAGAGAPAGTVATAVQAEAARELGLDLGDVIVLGGAEPVRLLVVGTWEPTDPSDPAWFAAPIVSAGVLEEGAGPFLVADDADLAGLPAAVVVRWTATPGPDAMTPERVADLRAALPNVEPALRAQDGIGADGLGASGALIATLDRLLAGLTTVRAIAPLSVLLIVVAGFAALDRLAALLTAARRGETLLLRARGASAPRIARTAAGEAVAVAGPAAILGVAFAETALSAVRPGGPGTWPVAGGVAAACLLGAVALLGGRAWWDATRPMLRGSGDEVGRIPRAAAAGGVLLVVVAAAVSLWQFRLYGSPLVVNASGVLEVDPIAVLAPMLVLVALALLGNGLVSPVAAALERLAAARPGLVPALPMRQLARRGGLYASASLMTMLGVGALTLAATFAGSWQAFDRAASAVEVGGDVRVAYAARTVVHDADPLALDDPFAGLGPVEASLPVFSGEARIGSDPATLIALPASDAARLGPALAAATADLPPVGAIDLPAGASTIDVAVRLSAAEGTPGEVAVSAWVLGSGGEASRLPAGSIQVGAGVGIAQVELPDVAGLRLLGFDASLAQSRGGEVTVQFGAVSIDGSPAASALQVDGETRLAPDRPVGRVAVGGEESDPVPVVLGAALAGRIEAGPGDALAFRILTGGADIDAIVADVVPAVPGAGGMGLLADLAEISAAAFADGSGVPAYTERWLATQEPAEVADGIREDPSVALTASTRSDASSAPLLGPAVSALWAGAAAALLFAAVALAALTTALARARFGEVVVLRALGMPARMQGRARLAELAVSLVTAALVGIVIGALTAVATVRDLARAAVAGAPGALPVDLALDVLPWVVGLVAFLGISTAIGAAAAASVRRLAATHGIREEER
ncbi:hypothetical protein BJ978_000094 [Agromyces terreus]|uniref:FtsX-like permease family protein n=1 Tax=Agromyces terreus TaxID=424795 RepID=A0A9X2GY07_9MICO|nr:hypothetical protein [Agromyces terreus]MCP2369418.1 hypothetical protein [Agromyces terreus]